MTRLVCLVAVVGVLLAAQPAAQRGPIIRWQPTNGPLGGEADSIVVHAGNLLCRCTTWVPGDRVIAGNPGGWLQNAKKAGG